MCIRRSLQEAEFGAEQGARQLTISGRRKSEQSGACGSCQSRGGVSLGRAGPEVVDNLGEAEIWAEQGPRHMIILGRRKSGQSRF